ncbi:MAG: site-specific integrase [Treponema sp.]|nr:site-specific integrase [Treponema sp.]
MDAAYLFYERENVSIPMMDFDPPLFKRLAGFGRWDRQNSRFILRYRLKAEQYRIIFADRPYIEVKKDLAAINGFFERPWPGRLAAADKLSKTDRTCLVSSIPPPERFSLFWVERLKEELHSRKYSSKTIKSYLHFNRDFCRIVKKPVEKITEMDFKKYLNFLDTVKDMSSSSMNLAISSIRFFYNNVMGRNFARDQYRPRQDKRLPGVLSREEIETLLDTENNPKHRLLLMMAYSSGLRVSEVVALKKEHIDFSRKTLLVYGAKGRKDRITILSDRAAAFLQEYCRCFDIANWLFPGQVNGHIRVRTAQNIFEKAIQNAKVQKNVSIHSLRHTFATHLLENGTDIKYIQILLGHSNLRTTERYTHIARRSILRIQSPLDGGPH